MKNEIKEDFFSVNMAIRKRKSKMFKNLQFIIYNPQIFPSTEWGM